MVWHLVLILLIPIGTHSFLYPRDSETRFSKSLNGLWKFRRSIGNEGFHERWYLPHIEQTNDWIDMPVPGSYQDITPDAELRDHVGWVFYRTSFYLTQTSKPHVSQIYFGAVDHYAIVWCNGKKVGDHKGGHVAFYIDLTHYAKNDSLNILAVAVNNTLTEYTIPQGLKTYINNSTIRYPSGTWLYSHGFDYFDYAGINRNVILYQIPLDHIIDFDFTASFDFSIQRGYLIYNVSATGLRKECYLTLQNDKLLNLYKATGCIGEMKDLEVLPWMFRDGYRTNTSQMYTVKIDVVFNNSYRDIYYANIGFRKVEVNTEKFIMNGEVLYLQGFGMHEDADLRGRGWDAVTMTRDVEMLKYLGANAIRTSHYPYSEEMLMTFDREGITVILEIPACSLNLFDDVILAEHIRVSQEIVTKYKHHPSIIMWSMANEPLSNKQESKSYFRAVKESIQSIDNTRPITFVTSQQIDNEQAADVVDVICVNRYSGWYQDPGRLDLIQYQVINELSKWHEKYNKAVIITEYGAASVSGQHNLAASMWSEDYQVKLLEEHFNALNILREKIAGEMIWNLIDFNTPQEYIRPGLCMKGVLTRQRQPKASAFAVKKRYTKPY